MKLVFWPPAWDDYRYWHAEDPKLLARLNALLKGCLRDVFHGTGKPEPLGGNLSGGWSRRINQEHRLVYRVSGKGEAQALQVAVSVLSSSRFTATTDQALTRSGTAEIYDSSL